LPIAQTAVGAGGAADEDGIKLQAIEWSARVIAGQLVAIVPLPSRHRPLTYRQSTQEAPELTNGR